jgi:hypothetical protein
MQTTSRVTDFKKGGARVNETCLCVCFLYERNREGRQFYHEKRDDEPTQWLVVVVVVLLFGQLVPRL